MKFFIFLTLFFLTIKANASTIEFYANGVMKPVKTDSVTPANSNPLPIRIYDSAGVAITSEAVGSNKAIHIKPQGAAYVGSARNNYSSVNVTAAAWVQLIAATGADSQGLTLFDSSGETLELGIGAAAAESRVLIIPPGGLDGYIPLRIASGSRVSVRAVSATASVGEINLNLF